MSKMSGENLTGFGEFCGGSIWSNNETWNTEDPDFTECFQLTILSWAPAAVLILLLPIEIWKCRRSLNGRIPLSPLNVQKVLGTLALVSTCVAELAISAKRDDIISAKIVALSVRIAAYVVSLILLWYSLSSGIQTSGPQFFFFLVDMISWIIPFRTLTRHYFSDFNITTPEEDQDLILITVQLCASCFMFFLNCWADQKPTNYNKERQDLKNPCPQLQASYLNKLFFIWVSGLIWTGFRKSLTGEDLWDVNPKITSKGLVPTFDKNYEKSKKKASEKEPVSPTIKFSAESENVDFKASSSKNTSPVSVFPALVKSFGGQFMIGAILKVTIDGLTVATPQVMKLMIGFASSYFIAGSEQEEWKGYLYGILLFATLTLSSVMTSQYFERMFKLAMNTRTVLISAIFRKSLKITAAAKKESSVGEIVNLMSVDVQRFMDLLPYINMLWSGPFQLGLSAYLMYRELHHAVWLGFATFLLTIPLNYYMAKKMRVFQMDQMKCKDERIKLMNEVLSGMKVLKLYAWEPSFIHQILGIRNKEYAVMKKSASFQAFLSFFWTSAPFLFTLVSFTGYVFIYPEEPLTAEKAFVVISYMAILRMPMAVLPMLVVFMVQCKVSLDRINKFMNSEELDNTVVSHDPSEKDAVTIEDGTFKWASDEPTVLHDINMKVKKGSLTAVVGTVGAGKSSLISTMLGELWKEKGRVNTLGQIAYVPQQAWIQNATLKDNIIFNYPDNKEQYEEVLEACALKSDLEVLPGGDQTEIGEKGINLSGGQKQRVSLARAVYSKADLFLFDDPLSAVDSHVGKHIFEKLIGPKGMLNNTTRLLVTHGITYLPHTDHIIVIKEGRISEQGSYQELLERKGDFANILIEYMDEQAGDDEEIEELKKEIENRMGKDEVYQRQVSKRERLTSTTSNGSVSSEKEKDSKEPKEKKEEKKAAEKPAQKLIEKEHSETGSVKMSVYGYYMKSIGFVGTLTALLGQAIYSATSLMANQWVSWWTEGKFGDATNSTANRDMYLGVYGGIGLAQSLSVVALSLVLAFTTLTASNSMHKNMLARIMMSPMSFFDTTPLGRIVNRFAKDIDVCDNTLPGNLRQWLSILANFIVTLVLILLVLQWQILIVLLPTTVIFFFIQRMYVNTSRQLKRLESVSRSPIYSHFQESINGSSTIRAFNMQKQFISQSEDKVDYNQKCYFPGFIANRWLEIGLGMIGNVITFAVTMFILMDHGTIKDNEVGLVITYSLNITQVLNWLVRMTSDVETNIVAVERIKEYCEIAQEAPWVEPQNRPGRSWPEEGKVQFDKYALRYREGLDLVIRDITCDIKGGEKIGIVGRTGAGKSTLTVALFRLVEKAMGSIIVDGIDISTIGLHDLRNKLTIIPQDPVLFNGSLRLNLDPFNMYPDPQIWAVLEQSHLKSFVCGLEAGLDHQVSEGGENLSVGQRQLVCLARALLRKTKVLILDEATAAVDMETDDLIQATIRKEFADCTVLTIAHRLNTIMDYNRIMVLDKGELMEFDSPAALTADPSTIFFGMAKDAGIVTENKSVNL